MKLPQFSEPLWADGRGRYHFPGDPYETFRTQLGQLKQGRYYVDDWRAGELSDISVRAEQGPRGFEPLSQDPTAPAGDTVAANQRASAHWYAAQDHVLAVEVERRAAIDEVNVALDALSADAGEDPIPHLRPSDFNSASLAKTLRSLQEDGVDPRLVDRLRVLSQRAHGAYAARTVAVNELGMNSGRDVAFTRLLRDGGTPDQIRVYGDPRATPKPGELDIIGLRWDPADPSSGRLLLIEAKGGAGELGSRLVDGDGRVQQGTGPYLRHMLEHDPQLLRLLRENPGLAEAIRAGTVRLDYVKVSQDLLPRLAGETPDGRPAVGRPEQPQAEVRAFQFSGPPNHCDVAHLWPDGIPPEPPAEPPSLLGGGAGAAEDSDAGTPPRAPAAGSGGSGPDLAHAALGHELGGAYRLEPDPQGTIGALRQVLDSPESLPPGTTVDPATGTVRMDLGDGLDYRVEFATAPVGEQDGITSAGHRYAPTAALHLAGDHASVHLSENASAEHVRQAVVSTLAEVRALLADRVAGTRFEGTSVLVDGAIPGGDDPVRLSPHDAGRAAAMRALADELRAAESVGDQSRVEQLRADALGMAARYGFADEAPAAPVHTLPDNAPTVGEAAVAARLVALTEHVGPDRYHEFDPVLHAPTREAGRSWGAELAGLRLADKQHLAAGVRDLIARREAADAALTSRVDAAQRGGEPTVFQRLIIGDGWAATEDYVTLGVPGDDGVGLPGVLCVGGHGDPWLGRGLLEMGQVPAELELPGLPLQPSQFTPDATGFTRAQDFALAIGAARSLSDMPTYHATVTRVEARPEGAAPGWPDGARYRVHLDGRPPLHTESVDIASGPGPSRVPGSGAGLPPRVIDPATRYSADFTTDPPTYRAPDGTVQPPRDLPDPVRARFGLDDRGAPASYGGRPSGPHLVDQAGRLTDPRVVDVASGISVDPDTGALTDAAGHPVALATVEPEVLRRLGLRPDGRRDPRFVDHPSGFSAHPVTGEVVRTGEPGRPVEEAALPPGVRDELTAALRERRVQFGGQNLGGDYRPGDRILVYGAGASGAWDIEQAATQGLGTRVEWTAIGRAGTDPFGGGYNRRNSVEGVGAYSARVRSQVSQHVRSPVEVRATTSGSFLVRFDDGHLAEYDRVVFSIGQSSTAPGGVAAIVHGLRLEPLYGPESAIDGLRDASGGLRLLGSAGTVGRPGVPGVGALLPEHLQAAVSATVAEQAARLPADSRNVTPAIRNHAGRIADQNRRWGTFHAGLTGHSPVPEVARVGQDLARAGLMVRVLPSQGDQDGLALIREGPDDLGTVARFALARVAGGDELVSQLTTVLSHTRHDVVLDGQSVGMDAAQARAAFAALDPHTLGRRRVCFVLADGSLLTLGGAGR